MSFFSDPSISKILVRAPNWIGDQILAYPFFYFLRRTFPKAQITSACVPWVASLQFRDLVDSVYVLPTPVQQSLGSKWEALEKGSSELRKRGDWDLGFSLPNSFSSAWILYRSGARHRVGYRTDFRGLLLNHGLDWQSRNPLHRAEAYVGLLAAFKAGGFPSAKDFWGAVPENELDQPEGGVLDAFDPEQAWPDSDPLEPPRHRYWVLAPGSVAESRRWSIEKFAALAGEIVQTTDLPGVLVGGASEAPAAERLVSSGLKLLNWTGRGRAASYWKVFKNAVFTVSNDSGLAHLASLCGSPVQIVWGAGDPRKTKPLGPGRVNVIYNPIDCWPCERNSCPLPDPGKLGCLKGIGSEDVWKEINQDGKPFGRSSN